MRARHAICLGVALALLPASLAQADIGPVPKPGAAVTPLTKPDAKPTKPATQQPSRQTTVTPASTRQAPEHTAPPAPATVSGGRDQSAVAPVAATGGRLQTASLPAAIAQLFPTRLAEVGDDSLPAYGSWPSWVLAVFTLLATAEAFLLVRLARARRYAQGERIRQLADF